MLELMLEPLLMPITIAFLGAVVCVFLPERWIRERGLVALSTSLLVLVTVWPLWTGDARTYNGPGILHFRADGLACLGSLLSAVFGVLISLYSLSYLKVRASGRKFFTYLLWTLGAAEGAFLADDLVLLLVFWGILGLTLYLMVGLAGPQAASAAKKTFIIVGATDSLLVMGVGIVWILTGSTRLSELQALNTAVIPLGVAFWTFVAAAFAKAGAFPLHTWLPEVGERALVPVTAYLPAALDKLLGIYLLARASIHIFALGLGERTGLMFLGAVTVIAAVMMALIQHDLRRLLAYHAVSQVGYMVLGIGTGTVVGVAGGVFHMLNHSIYKSCLFLGAGAVETECGHTDLDRLGGLARVMPLTFAGFLVAAMAISGIPPLNGFASKWMVYQGIIQTAGEGRLWIVWLAAAMLGSALTLASFVKAMHAAFLRKASAEVEAAEPREPSAAMWLPMLVLALFCVGLGVGLHRISLPLLIRPAVDGALKLAGVWAAGPATFMLLAALAAGLGVYVLTLRGRVRRTGTYIGGEILSQTYVSGVGGESPPDLEVTGVDFYREIERLPGLGRVYAWARQGAFDLYAIGLCLIGYFVEMLRAAHTGVLLNYVSWVIAGLLGIMFVVLR
ncbi:MAG TPA: NADH-quinone oxidoreductase subunit L [Kiritimatiellae bacterium]|nr:NADH-quinone oxidoreductase subunit L [Kiritimatiellia bacterium]